MIAMGLGLGTVLSAAACSPSGPRLNETSSELVTVTAIGGGNFGDIQVGASSGPITIRVAPSGAGDTYDIATAVTESCANFSVVPGSLPREVSKYCLGGGGEIPRIVEPGERQASATGGSSTAAICSGGYEIIEYSFPAYFTPTVAGAQSCVITVTLDGGAKTVMVTGNGLPPPREIDVSRASIAFGDVRLRNMSTPQTVVVSNTGSAALTISSATVTGAAFSLSGAASTTIAGNSSYPYTVTCSPGDSLGPLSGSFRIVSDDPDEGTLTLPLSCAGVDSNLTVQPSPISLAARVAEPSELVVALVNSGGAPMNVTSVTVAGTDLELITAPTGAIPAGGSMQARLRYMARNEADISGMLSVSFDGQTRGVPVSARAKAATMSISPDGDVDLGAVCVGTTKEQTFSALGTGGAAFVISNVSVTGEGFALASAAGPINVAGAGANTVAVRANAAPTVPGEMTGQVQVTTDIPVRRRAPSTSRRWRSPRAWAPRRPATTSIRSSSTSRATCSPSRSPTAAAACSPSAAWRSKAPTPPTSASSPSRPSRSRRRAPPAC